MVPLAHRAERCDEMQIDGVARLGNAPAFRQCPVRSLGPAAQVARAGQFPGICDDGDAGGWLHCTILPSTTGKCTGNPKITADFDRFARAGRHTGPMRLDFLLLEGIQMSCRIRTPLAHALFLLAAAQAAQAAPFAYITEMGARNVKVIDTVDDTVIANIAVG